MAADLHAANAHARAVLDQANDILGFDLTGIMFGDDEAVLKATQNTQPALYVHSMAALAAMDTSEIGMTAGHSLGEYSALAAAGAISFEDGLRMVRLRGELMAGAGDDRPGGMAALIGMEDADVERLCVEASDDTTVVQPANYNSPGQIVISGDAAAVERAVVLAPDRGARRAIPLPVSGAFHSPLMAHAADGLAEGLRALAIVAPRVPVYLNVTGEACSDPGEIRSRLLEQLTAPVRWSQTLTAMHRDGATTFVEVGAGKVLAGLVKRTLGRDVETRTVGTADEL